MKIVLTLAAIFWAVAYIVTKEIGFIIISSVFSCTLALVVHSEIHQLRNSK